MFTATISKNRIIAGIISDMDHISDTFWEVTYRKNIGKMIGVCWRYTQNRQTAEDLAHDAFILAINKVSGFENKGPFEAWLRRIVVNVALQYVRERKKEEKLEQMALYPYVSDEVRDDIDRNENPTFSESELLEAIGCLPEHHRLVFNLYVIDNLTHAEIADRLGLSEGTSKSHLARGRKKIREILSDKLRNDRERKRAFFWLIFSFRDVDQLIANGLNNFSLDPRRQFPADQLPIEGHAFPPFKSAAIANAFYLKVGMLVCSVAILFSVIKISHLNTHEETGTIEPATLEMRDSIPTGIPQKKVIHTTATIPENPIIVEKTKNKETMKNLNALKGLLVAGIILDTSSLSKGLPIQPETREIATYHVIDANSGKNKTAPDHQKKPELLSGSFYASSILWSDDSHKLLLFGNNVKVDLNNQKFTGNGKFSFLSNIQYVVVNGTPMKLNETIQLEKKKYNLKQMNELDGEKKYGDSGKYGVVEITLAE